MTRRALGAAFTVMVMLAVPVLARAAGISVQRRKGATEVVVRDAGKVTFSIYRLEAPPRLVLKMNRVHISGPSLVDAYTPEVSQIRVKKSGNSTNLMIGLADRVRYRVRMQGRNLVVRIVSLSAQAARSEVEQLRAREQELRSRMRTARRRLAELEKLQGRAKLRAQAETARLKQRIRQYRSRMNELESRRKALESSVRTYEAKLAQARATEKKLRRKLAAMEKRLTAIVAQSEQKEAELARLQKESRRLSNRRDDTRAEIEALERKLHELKGRMNAGGRKATKARQQMKAIRRALESARSRLNRLNSDIARSESRRKALSREIAAREVRLAEVTRELRETRTRLNSMVKHLRDETARLRQERDSLKRELSSLKKERRELKSVRAQASALHKRMRELKKNLRTLQTRVSRLESREQEMVQRYEKARIRWETMDQRLTDARTRMQSLRGEERSLTSKIAELRKRHRNLNAKEEQRLRSAGARERRRILEARRLRERQIRSLERKRKALNRRLEQTRRDVAWLTKKAENLQKRVAGQQARLEKVRAEVAALASRRDRLSGEMTDLQDRRISLKAELKARKARLASIEQEIASRRAKLATLDARISSREISINRLQTEERRLAGRMAALQKKADALKARISSYQAEVKRLESERNRLRTEKQRLAHEVRSLKLSNSQLRTVHLKAKALISGVDFVDSPWSNQVILSFNRGDIPARVVRRNAREIVVRIPGAILKPELRRKVRTDAYSGPISEFTTWHEVHGSKPYTMVKIRLTGKRRFEIRHRPGKLVLLVAKNRHEIARSKALRRRAPRRKVASYSTAVHTVAASVPAAPRRRGVRRRKSSRRRRRYTGRFVDLDFKDADIQNVIRLVAEVWGKNVVIPDEVKGTITIRLTNVRVDRAFDVILKSKGLTWKDEGGNIIRIITLQQLQAERQERMNRMKAKVTLTPLQTKLIPVNYAEADKLAKAIESNVKSSRGRVTVDKRTNIIIYVDVPAKIRLAQQLVKSLDLPTPQVQIEARIVEAESNFIRELGIQWGGSMFSNSANGNPTGLIFPSNVGIAGGSMDQKTMTSGVPEAGAANPDFAVNLPANVGTGAGGAIGIALGSLAGAVNINLRLSAMEEIGQVRSISAPKITTLDNVEAKISQGVEIPYPLSSAQGQSVIMKQAVLSLSVTPHVTNDGRVRMKIKVTKDEPDETHRGADGSLGISKKSAETELLVRSGDTVVIGGIYKRQSTLLYKKVPWFADIPIVGWFFKNQYKKDARSELLIFITPRVLNRRPIRSAGPVAPGAGK